MWRALAGLVLSVSASAVFAQEVTRPAGLETDWEIASVLREIGSHASRLTPALDRVNVKRWVEKGASDTYLAQLDSAKDQARAIATSAKVLADNPERLPAALELYFRIEGLDTMLNSLVDGLRRYESPAAAQTLAALGAENGANRGRLERYIVNLAAQREQDYQVMDREAQRCRASITQVPPKTGRKK